MPKPRHRHTARMEQEVYIAVQKREQILVEAEQKVLNKIETKQYFA